MTAQDARDISQINEVGEIPVVSGKRSAKLLWIVLGCVVVGVTLGIVAYQQSLKPATPVKRVASPTPKVVTPSPVVEIVTSPEPAEISAVSAAPKKVTFPKAGKLRIYYSGTEIFELSVKNASGAETKFSIPAGNSSTPMKILDTGYQVNAGDVLTVNSRWIDMKYLSVGWAAPKNGKCGFNGGGQVPVASLITWATEQAKGEPLVSQQCWGDYSPDPEKDASAKYFNDYFVVLSYSPVSAVASSSPVASAKASSSPVASVAASPSLSPSPSPSPSPSRSPSPSPSIASPVAGVAAISPSPAASARVSMPDTKGGVPVTGVFEITVATVGVGLVLLILGMIGLLVL